ncbi:accessory factor UbiK family protein [Pseudomonas sp. Marseille-QA0892]
MLPPKSLFETVNAQVSRLLTEAPSLPRGEVESQLKMLLQSAFSRLDLVSREEFDTQMVVLERTRTRLEALERKLEALEAQTAKAPEVPRS